MSGLEVLEQEAGCGIKTCVFCACQNCNWFTRSDFAMSVCLPMRLLIICMHRSAVQFRIYVKLCAIGYVGNIYECATFGVKSVLYESLSMYVFVTSLQKNFPYSRAYCIGQTAQPILMFHGLNDADWSKEVPFGFSSKRNVIGGTIHFPKFSKGILLGTQKSIFWMVKDGWKISHPTCTNPGSKNWMVMSFQRSVDLLKKEESFFA